MKHRSATIGLLTPLLLALVIVGCDEYPPPPLPEASQAPAGVEPAAVSGAGMEVKAEGAAAPAASLDERLRELDRQGTPEAYEQIMQLALEHAPDAGAHHELIFALGTLFRADQAKKFSQADHAADYLKLAETAASSVVRSSAMQTYSLKAPREGRSRTVKVGGQSFTIDKQTNTINAVIDNYPGAPGTGRIVTLLGPALNPLYTEKRRDFDLLLMDANGRIVDTHGFRRAGENAPCRPTTRYSMMLALPAGSIQSLSLKVGDQPLPPGDLTFFKALF